VREPDERGDQFPVATVGRPERVRRGRGSDAVRHVADAGRHRRGRSGGHAATRDRCPGGYRHPPTGADGYPGADADHLAGGRPAQQRHSVARALRQQPVRAIGAGHRSGRAGGSGGGDRSPAGRQDGQKVVSRIVGGPTRGERSRKSLRGVCLGVGLLVIQFALSLSGAAAQTPVPPAGGWTEPELVYETSDEIDQPSVIADDFGGTHIIWRQTGREAAGDPDPLESIYYLTNRDGQWT